MMEQIRYYFLSLVCLIFQTGNTLAMTQLSNVRQGNHDNFDRIVFDLSDYIDYQIDKQTDNKNLYLQLNNCNSNKYGRLAKAHSGNTIVNSIWLEKAAINDIKIRMAMNNTFTYQVRRLKLPWRIVVDIFPQEGTVPVISEPQPDTVLKEKEAKSDSAVIDSLIAELENSIDTKDDTLRVTSSDTTINLNNSSLIDNNQNDTLSLASTEETKSLQASYSLGKLALIAFLINCIVFAAIGIVRVTISQIKKPKSKSPKKQISAPPPQKYDKVIATTKSNSTPPKNDFKTVMNNKLGSDYFKTSANTPKIDSKKDLNRYEKPAERIINAYKDNHSPVTMKIDNDKINNLYQRVEQFLRYHYDIKSIARELNLGQDEVRMIINLSSKRDGEVSEFKTNHNEVTKHENMTNPDYVKNRFEIVES
jgi:hypothetical protein